MAEVDGWGPDELVVCLKEKHNVHLCDRSGPESEEVDRVVDVVSERQGVTRWTGALAKGEMVLYVWTTTLVRTTARTKRTTIHTVKDIHPLPLAIVTQGQLGWPVRKSRIEFS